jgi:hypothetical protein
MVSSHFWGSVLNHTSIRPVLKKYICNRQQAVNEKGNGEEVREAKERGIEERTE